MRKREFKYIRQKKLARFTTFLQAEATPSSLFIKLEGDEEFGLATSVPDVHGLRVEMSALEFYACAFVF